MHHQIETAQLTMYGLAEMPNYWLFVEDIYPNWFLWCVCVLVAQLCLTLCDPMD